MGKQSALQDPSQLDDALRTQFPQGRRQGDAFCSPCMNSAEQRERVKFRGQAPIFFSDRRTIDSRIQRTAAAAVTRDDGRHAANNVFEKPRAKTGREETSAFDEEPQEICCWVVIWMRDDLPAGENMSSAARFAIDINEAEDAIWGMESPHFCQPCLWSI